MFLKLKYLGGNIEKNKRLRLLQKVGYYKNKYMVARIHKMAFFPSTEQNAKKQFLYFKSLFSSHTVKNCFIFAT